MRVELMRRRILIITKEPEFDTRDEVVLGQCEPFTSGWSLIMIDENGVREQLLIGTYTDLRRIQESCSGVDDLASVRRRVVELRKLLTAAVTETVAVQFTTVKPNPEEFVTREMEAVKTNGTPTHSTGGLLNLELNGTVLVATVVQPERADDADYLKHELESVLNCHAKAVVMDLGRVPNLSPGSFKQLAGVRDRLRESGADFALCNLTGAMQQNMTKINESLPVFETQASALAALKG
jgi:anti-anti-sigma regulatory factor